MASGAPVGPDGVIAAVAPSTAYLPWLDGLRAVAVAAVMLFHHDDAIAPGGFLGVDVFFVLSGYLITGILRREQQQQDRVALLQFWVRRARRLLPALLAMLAMVAAIAWLAFPDHELARLRPDALAALFYVENWYHIGRGTTAVSHTWSLAVEEQWYLLWPVVFVALARFVRDWRALVVSIGTLALASAIWTAVLFDPNDADRAYFGTDVRAQALLIGSAFAVFATARPDLVARSSSTALGVGLGAGLGAIGALVVAFFAVDFDSEWLYRGGLGCVALAVVVVLWSCLQADNRLAGALGAGPLPAIGKVSYGLYLYHWPLYWWLDADRTGLSGWWLFALRVAATSTVAAASYRWLEQPIRSGGRVAGWRFGIALVVAVPLVGSSIMFATRAPANAQELARVHLAFSRVSESGPSDATRLLVVGDQAALVLARQAPSLVDGVWTSALGSYSCHIGPGRLAADSAASRRSTTCQNLDASLQAAADGFDADVVVVAVGASFGADRIVRGVTMPMGSQALTRQLHRSLDELQSRVGGDAVRFVIAGVPCQLGASEDAQRRAGLVDEVLRQYVETRSSVRYVDVAAHQCPGGEAATIDGDPIVDLSGLTEAGIRSTWEYLVEQARA